MKRSLEIWVQQAKEGDRKALEKVIENVRDLVYNLSLRMLLYPAEAEDATQEILVKIVTHLGTFKGDSAFTTWVYRVATNYLLNYKKKRKLETTSSFEDYAVMIDSGQSETIQFTQNKGEQLLLEEEVKVSCTHGMLLCLSETSRLVYIFGALLDFNSIEGGKLLDISPENFRKQLSRSKSKLRNFLADKCGLANPQNPCRCSKKVDFLIQGGQIDPKNLKFVTRKERSLDLINTISSLEKSAAIFRSTPQFSTPELVVQKMKETLKAL